MVNALENASVMHLESTPGETIREGWTRRLIRTGRLMTAVLDVEGGPWTQADPPHSHPHDQITYIASGEVIFLAEGREPARLQAGDLFAVPTGVPHSIQLLSKTARLVDTFHPIREDFIK